jgi:hypothetical protein
LSLIPIYHYGDIFLNIIHGKGDALGCGEKISHESFGMGHGLGSGCGNIMLTRYYLGKCEGNSGEGWGYARGGRKEF